MNDYLWPPAPPASLSVRGLRARYPVNRLFFVGRNYHAHALEMVGQAVDKAAERPFYFTKSPHALCPSGQTLPYPPATANYQHEIELVVALGAAGFRVRQDQAQALIYGYAVGLDMTRRDLQIAARDRGRPWDLGKDAEGAAVCSEIVPKAQAQLAKAAIELEVNGVRKQASTLDQLVWSVPELIADLSTYYHLQAGDLIFTGTPEGVGPVVAGDHITGRVRGLAEVSLRLCAAE